METHKNFYPDDIRYLILSYYYNSTYFERDGNLCTINTAQNILTYEYSWFHATAKRCLIAFIKFMVKFSIMIVLYKAVAMIELLPFVLRWSYQMNVGLGWLSFEVALFPFLCLIMPYYIIWSKEIKYRDTWLSTSSCCYVSNIMPSYAYTHNKRYKQGRVFILEFHGFLSTKCMYIYSPATTLFIFFRF